MRGREGVLQPRPGRADTTYGTRARCRCPSALETSRMSSPTAPATVVFCHRLADSTTPEQLAARDTWARGSGIEVTWAADLGTLATLVTGQGDAVPVRAVADDASWWTSRAATRDRLQQMTHTLPGIDTLVIGGGRPLQHRELLRDHGIRIVCVDRFDEVARGSRRPAPAGWQCRSLCWGLWEVALTAPQRGVIARLTGRAGDPRPVAGGLTVLAAADEAGEVGAPAPRALRSVGQWVARGVAATVLLGGLPQVVASGSSQSAGSVLRAA